MSLFVQTQFSCSDLLLVKLYVIFQQPPRHCHLDVPAFIIKQKSKLTHHLPLKASFPCSFLLVSPWLERLESSTLPFPFLISFYPVCHHVFPFKSFTPYKCCSSLLFFLFAVSNLNPLKCIFYFRYIFPSKILFGLFSYFPCSLLNMYIL